MNSGLPATISAAGSPLQSASPGWGLAPELGKQITPPGVLSPSWRGCLDGRTNLRIILRTHFVATKVEPSRIRGFEGPEPIYGMQGGQEFESIWLHPIKTQSETGFFNS